MNTAMDYALGEVEALARKAARGAGMTWGLADEAAQATRWLCGHTLPGAFELASLLQLQDGLKRAKMQPVIRSGNWYSNAESLCPITTGAALTDRAAELSKCQSLTLSNCRKPLLLLPFIAQAARMTKQRFSISFGEARYVLTDTAPHMVAPWSVQGQATVDTILIQPTDAVQGTPLPQTFRAEMTKDVLSSLEHFAYRTYAPDTAQSRASGAGAGLTDND